MKTPIYTHKTFPFFAAAILVLAVPDVAMAQLDEVLWGEVLPIAAPIMVFLVCAFVALLIAAFISNSQNVWIMAGFMLLCLFALYAPVWNSGKTKELVFHIYKTPTYIGKQSSSSEAPAPANGGGGGFAPRQVEQAESRMSRASPVMENFISV